MHKNINEGLIPVPSKLQSQIKHYVASTVLWVIRDKFTPEIRKKSPAQWAELQNEIKRWGVTIPEEQFVPGKITAKSFLFDTGDMPKNYHHLDNHLPDLKVVLDWDGKFTDNAIASYRTVKSKKDGSLYSVIIIHLNNAPAFNDVPGPFEDEISLVLPEIFSSLDHELRHLVQVSLLQKKDARQANKLPDYEKSNDAYHNSQIEFDPFIGSAIDDFVRLYKYLSSLSVVSQISLSNAVKMTVGAIPAKIGIGYSPEPFFLSLKKKNPEKWRVAVRKFAIGVANTLKEKTDKP